METKTKVPKEYWQGFAFFDGRKFKVDERVLVPRKETELLVEAAMDLPEGARVHEVGTGCGAVAISIKMRRPDLRVSASDISRDAVNVARGNSYRLNAVIPITCDEGIPAEVRENQWVDLLVANLPYLTDESIQEREEVVRSEPEIATIGRAHEDGLYEIRKLVEECPSKWRVALEHDTHQGEEVRDLLYAPQTICDLGGGERMTTGLVP